MFFDIQDPHIQSVTFRVSSTVQCLTTIDNTKHVPEFRLFMEGKCWLYFEPTIYEFIVVHNF